jgi:hypothetical protein
MCIQRLRFEPFPYQLEAAARVLGHLQARAILADEVGLGKTIEAGVVVSELLLYWVMPVDLPFGAELERKASTGADFKSDACGS